MCSSDLFPSHDKVVEAAIAANAGIATKNQIQSYVRLSPGVIDCNLDADPKNPNQVIVYVKPVVGENVSFSQIQDNLDLFGEAVTTYKVLPGEPIKVDLLLSSTLLNANQRYIVIQHLKQVFAYEKLNFVVDLSPSKINDIAQEIVGTSIASVIQITSDILISGRELQTPTPIYRNSLKLFIGNTLEAWDSDRLLIAKSELQNIDPGYPVPWGDYYLSSKEPIMFDGSVFCNVDMDILNIVRFLKTSNEVMVETLDGNHIFEISDYFKDTEISLLVNPYTRVTPKVSLPHLNLENAIYVEGKALYKVVLYQGSHHLWKYDIGVDLIKLPNFDVAVTSSGWNLLSVIQLVDDMVLFFRRIS